MVTKVINKTTTLARTFAALGDRTRFQIMRLLLGNPELCVSEVAERVGISTAGVSQHMQVLERAGLLKRERMGQRICYRINQDSLTSREILKLMEGES